MDRRPTFFAIKEQLQEKSLDSLVLVVLTLYFLWHISSGLIQPFINPFFFELSSGDYFLTGMLNGIPYFSMIFSVFIFGAIVDKFGPKRVIIFGYICYLVLVVWLLFITDALIFFIIYVSLNSLMTCFVPAVLKYASLTREDIFGLMAAIASMGYFFGSVTGGILYDLGSMNILFILAVISCVIGVIVSFIAKDIRESNRSSLEISEISERDATRELSGTNSYYLKILVILFAVAAVSYFQSGFSSQFTTIYLIEELGASSAIIGIMFGGATLLGTFASDYAGKFGKRTGKFKPVLMICYISYAFVWLAYLDTTDILILTVMYMIPVYVGLFVAGPTIISSKIPEGKRGTFLGIFTSLQYSGMSIGVILGGYMADIQGTIRYNFAVSTMVCVLLVIMIAIFYKEE